MFMHIYGVKTANQYRLMKINEAQRQIGIGVIENAIVEL